MGKFSFKKIVHTVTEPVKNVVHEAEKPLKQAQKVVEQVHKPIQKALNCTVQETENAIQAVRHFDPDDCPSGAIRFECLPQK